MTLQIVTVPCLKDNYAFLAHDPETGATACIDVPDARPILAALQARGWRLSDILLTHHHSDHIAGVAALVAATGAFVIGAAEDAHRLPPLDEAVVEGDRIRIGTVGGTVIDVSGHTIGHIAFLFPGAAFTGDSLMALGCGRLFEGTGAQMWASLQKFDGLPDDTLVCSGHEYTEANARFACTIDPANPALILRRAEVLAARAAGVPSVPSTLGEERATNPFLRPADPAIRAHLGLPDATEAQVFTEIRARKDRF